MSFAAYVCEGSEPRMQNLEIIGLNGAIHESLIEEYWGDFVVRRGMLTRLSFVADYWGLTKSGPSQGTGD